MRGTERQIEWAKKILAGWTKRYSARHVELAAAFIRQYAAGHGVDAEKAVEMHARGVSMMLASDDAGWIIEHKAWLPGDVALGKCLAADGIYSDPPEDADEKAAAYADSAAMAPATHE